MIDGENGFLKPVSELKDAMQRLIDDLELVIEKGQQSQEITEEKCSNVGLDDYKITD